jgi:hypothetical protein
VTPLLTIAVPTFRRPDMLRGCIGSLLPQLPEDGRAELLVVDNDPAGSAAAVTESLAHPGLRYVREPRPGVVHGRNRAVAEAGGRYLGFIDDDELALPGWVDALLRHAGMGVAASFGIVRPRYLGPRELGLETVLDTLYTRDLKRAQDADISDKWIHVGTGNSLFDREQCFDTSEPFAAHLNATGGEDVWLMRSLVARGVPLRWNPAAAVEELVPPERATGAYARSRRLRQGQQRIVLMLGEGGAKGWGKAALWMGVGAAQLALHSARGAALRALGRPEWRAETVRAQGGLGKLLWWKLWDSAAYGGGE